MKLFQKRVFVSLLASVTVIAPSTRDIDTSYVQVRKELEGCLFILASKEMILSRRLSLMMSIHFMESMKVV